MKSQKHSGEWKKPSTRQCILHTWGHLYQVLKQAKLIHCTVGKNSKRLGGRRTIKELSRVLITFYNLCMGVAYGFGIYIC